MVAILLRFASGTGQARWHKFPVIATSTRRVRGGNLIKKAYSEFIYRNISYEIAVLRLLAKKNYEAICVLRESEICKIRDMW